MLSLPFVIFMLIAIPITVIDVKEKRIPDFLSLGGSALLGLWYLLKPPEVFLIKGAEWAGAFLLFWVLRKALKGKMGMGDVKYAAFLGLALGFPEWYIATALASVLALVFSLIAIGLGKIEKQSRIPFAPFLSLGALGAFGFTAIWGRG